jgi:hypothetical protein
MSIRLGEQSLPFVTNYRAISVSAQRWRCIGYDLVLASSALDANYRRSGRAGSIAHVPCTDGLAWDHSVAVRWLHFGAVCRRLNPLTVKPSRDLWPWLWDFGLYADFSYFE